MWAYAFVAKLMSNRVAPDECNHFIDDENNRTERKNRWNIPDATGKTKLHHSSAFK